jgi:hypothetical protein
MKMREYSKARGINTFVTQATGINVTKNHNRLAQDMIGDWLLIVGSDHTFGEDALIRLLEAANEEPYPKIIGGVSVYRGYPNRLVTCKLDASKERMFSLTPYIDYHPGEMMFGSGQIRQVDVLGSGFCMYHREVFDTIPYPWFQYAPQPVPQPRLEKLMRQVIAGETSEEMVSEARQLLAMSRRPHCIGPDYWFNLNARNYGFNTYVHWGVPVLHWDWEAKHPGHYVAWVTSESRHWWAEALEGVDLTEQGIQDLKKQAEEMGVTDLIRMNPEELVQDYAEKVGAGTVGGSEQSPELESEAEGTVRVREAAEDGVEAKA